MTYLCSLYEALMDSFILIEPDREVGPFVSVRLSEILHYYKAISMEIEGIHRLFPHLSYIPPKSICHGGYIPYNWYLLNSVLLLAEMTQNDTK